MKMKVMIDSQTYLVDVEDIHARPVIAIVDGERYEVWPEGRSITKRMLRQERRRYPLLRLRDRRHPLLHRPLPVARTSPHRCRVSLWRSWSNRATKSPADRSCAHWKP